MALILAGVLAAVVWVASLSGYQLTEAEFNVDSLVVPLVAEDVLLRGGKLSDWYLPQAPSYFPDILLAGLLTFPIADPVIRVVAAAVAQVALTFGAIWYLTAKTVRSRYPVFALLALTFMVWEGLIPPNHFVDKFFMHIFAHLYSLAFHYGTFICVLVLAALWIAADGKEQQGGGAVLIAVIMVFCVVLGVSDLLFVVQAAAPLMLTALLVYGVDWTYTRKRVLVPVAAFLCAAAGAWLYRYLNDKALGDNIPTNISYIISLIPDRLGTLYHLMSVIIPAAHLFTVMLVVYLALVVYAFYRLFAPEAQTEQEKNLLFLTVFSFISIVCAMGAQLLFAPFSFVDRYMMSLFFFPLIIPVIYLGRIRGKAPAIAALCLVACMTFILTGNVINHVRKFGLRHSFSSEIACIDKALAQSGARHGIAEYWYARALQYFSTLDLRTAQFDFPELLPHPRYVSERYYGSGYDFIIIPQMNGSVAGGNMRANIVRWNGEPRYETVCSGQGVLVYDEGQLRVSRFSKVGDVYRQYGCELGVGFGKRMPDCTAEIDATDYPGDVLFFTMYLKELPAGRYSFEGEYVSPAAAATEAAHWRVMIFGRSLGETKTGPVYGSEGTPARYSGEFVVSPGDERNEAQITLFVKPGNSFKQIYIDVRRLE